MNSLQKLRCFFPSLRLAQPGTSFTILTAVALVLLCSLPLARGQNTQDNFDGQTGGTAGGPDTSLTVAGDYSTGSLPSATNDVLLLSSSSALTANSSLIFGSLDVTNGNTYSIANNSGTADTLTLGGGLNEVGASTSDLIYLGNNSTLTLTGTGTSSKTLGLVLAASGNFDVTSGSALTISSVISGSGMSVADTGAGNVTFSGANSFTGGLSVLAGTTTGTVANAFGGAGTGAITLGAASGTTAATLVGGATATFANPITLGAGTGTLTIENNGGTTAPVFSGAVNLGGSTLTLSSTGTGTLNASIGANVGLTFSGVITGTGSVVVNGGTVYLSDTNHGTTSSVLSTFTGGVYVQSGTLIGNNGSLGYTSSTGTGYANGNVYLGVAGTSVTSSSNSATLAFPGGTSSAVAILVQPYDAGTLTVTDLGGTSKSFNLYTNGIAEAGGTSAGPANININEAGPATSGFVFNGSGININGTVTDTSTGAGFITMGTIGSSVTGVYDNSSTSVLTLSGSASTYKNGLFVEQGYVNLGGNSSSTSGPAGPAANTITLGLAGTSGVGNSTTNSATVAMTSAYTVTNPIVLAAYDTGALTIAATGTGVNNNYQFQGGITGANNLNLANNGLGTLIIGVTSVTVNNNGTITSLGSGTGNTSVNAPIGNLVSSITENGTSPLLLTGTSPNYAGTMTVTSGTLSIGSSSITNTAFAAVGAITVNGGTLTGPGTLGTTTSTTLGAITLNNTGNITPGVAGGTTTSLKAGSLTFNPGGMLTYTLGATTSGTTGATNPLTLTGALTLGTVGSGTGYNVNLSGGVVNDTYVLASFASTTFSTTTPEFTAIGDTGTFSIVTAGSLEDLDFTVSSVTTVPEPKTTVMAGLLLLTALCSPQSRSLWKRARRA